MHRIRGKLTYSNVASTLCLVLLLGGGTAYAATTLGKEAVDTRQLAKEAVTPAKLSKASKKALTGDTGRQGPAGPQGPQGPQGAGGKDGAPGRDGDPGKEGPRGPGAVTIEHLATSTPQTVATFAGLRVVDLCEGPNVRVGVEVEPGAKTFTAFGTKEINGAISPINVEGATASLAYGGPSVSLDIVARNTAVGSAYTRFDLRATVSGCRMSGVVTPSEAG